MTREFDAFRIRCAAGAFHAGIENTSVAAPAAGALYRRLARQTFHQTQ